MAFIPAPDFWSADFGIDRIDWSGEVPAQVSIGRYTAKRSVVADPWASKLYGSVQLVPIVGDANIRAIRSFLRRSVGVINTFRIPATASAQNDNVGVAVAVDAAAGASTLEISGYTTPLLDGEYFTINGQLCMCTADQDGDQLRFEPRLRQAAAAGTTVVTSRPYALVAMASSRQGWTVSGVTHGVSFEVEEAVLEEDGDVPEGTASTFAELDAATARSPLRWTPTGERVTYSPALGLWLTDSGVPLASVLARFNGTAGQGIDSGYEIEAWRTSRDFSAAMSFQRINSETFFELDGAGAAALNQDATLQPYYLDAAGLIPAGSSDWEGYIDTIPGATTSGNPILFRTDAIHSSGVRIDNAGGALQIVDHIYGTVGGAPRVLQSAPFPEFDRAISRRIFVSFNGREVTARDEESGLEIKGVSALAEGHLAGIYSRRATTKFEELAIYPRDLQGFRQVGDMRFVGGRGLFTLAAAGAVNGLDRGDHALVVYGTEFNTTSGGVPEANGPANIRLARMDKATGELTYLTEIDSNTDSATTDRIVRIEGLCIFEVGGVVHVSWSGPDDGKVMLYRAPNPDDLTTPGHWPRAQINTQPVPNAEHLAPVDLGDGYVRLVCAYQGNTGTGGAHVGGILCLKLTGADTLNAASWTNIQWVDCPGAWGLAGRTEHIVDLLGDGSRKLLFGSRVNARNPDGLGGVHYIDIDEGGVDSAGKTLVTAYDPAAEDVTRLDFVDLGAGHGLDVAYIHGGSNDLHLLTNPRAAGAWAHGSVALPVTTSHPFNCWSSGHRRNGKSVILVVLGIQENGGLYAVSHDGAAWGHRIIHRMPVDHTFEKPFLFRFSLSNGLYYWIGGDDNANMARAFAFLEESAVVPEAPAIVIPTQAETEALIAAMTSAPSVARAAIINDLIYELKDCGAWEHDDALWLLAAHHSQAAGLNWKDPATLILTVNGAPVFTVDRGYQFDGVDDYLATGYNPTAASLGYALNDAHVGVISLANTAGNFPDFGTANNTTRLVNRGTAGTSFALNRTAGASTSATGLAVTVPCHAVAARDGAASQKLFVNGRLTFSNTSASNTLADEFYVGRGGSQFSPRPLAGAHVGRAYPTDEMYQRKSLAVMRYMAELGVLG